MLAAVPARPGKPGCDPRAQRAGVRGRAPNYWSSRPGRARPTPRSPPSSHGCSGSTTAAADGRVPDGGPVIYVDEFEPPNLPGPAAARIYRPGGWSRCCRAGRSMAAGLGPHGGRPVNPPTSARSHPCPAACASPQVPLASSRPRARSESRTRRPVGPLQPPALVGEDAPARRPSLSARSAGRYLSRWSHSWPPWPPWPPWVPGWCSPFTIRATSWGRSLGRHSRRVRAGRRCGPCPMAKPGRPDRTGPAREGAADPGS